MTTWKSNSNLTKDGNSVSVSAVTTSENGKLKSAVLTFSGGLEGSTESIDVGTNGRHKVGDVEVSFKLYEHNSALVIQFGALGFDQGGRVVFEPAEAAAA